MGGGHVGGQLALFFGLCQPKPSLTLSPAAPGAVSLQPSGRPAQPALLVAKAMATPSNAAAERAHCVLQGQACCIKTSIRTSFGRTLHSQPQPHLGTSAPVHPWSRHPSPATAPWAQRRQQQTRGMRDSCSLLFSPMPKK